MATLATGNPTLADWIKRTNPDGSIATIVEMLNETNDVLDDIAWEEANGAMTHMTTVRTGLPASTWRKLYGGVQPTKSTNVQVVETLGMLEQYSEVDKDLAMLNGNTAAFRLTEDAAHIEGMNQDFVEALFYNDTDINPERFLGFSARYDDLSAESGDNIIAAGGAGSDNASIWLIVWGADVHCLFPKGQVGGLMFEDLGQETVTAADGGYFEALRSHYQWKPGLSVRDWRKIVRIANIDKSALTADASSGADLPDLLVQALELVKNRNVGRAAFYSNRTVKSFLRRQIINANNVRYGQAEVAGKHVDTFDGVPFRQVDALDPDEAAVT